MVRRVLSRLFPSKVIECSGFETREVAIGQKEMAWKRYSVVTYA